MFEMNLNELILLLISNYKLKYKMKFHNFVISVYNISMKIKKKKSMIL